MPVIQTSHRKLTHDTIYRDTNNPHVSNEKDGLVCLIQGLLHKDVFTIHPIYEWSL